MCRRTGRTVFGNWERTEDERKVSKALESVAKQVGAQSIQAGQSLRSPAQLSAHLFLFFPTLIIVAIAYVMQKTPYVFPIIGCRKIEQLQANIEALDVSLSPEQMKYLESILPFEPGFPHGMVVGVFVDVHACSWYKRAHVSLCRATDRSTFA